MQFGIHETPPNRKPTLRGRPVQGLPKPHTTHYRRRPHQKRLLGQRTSFSFLYIFISFVAFSGQRLEYTIPRLSSPPHSFSLVRASSLAR